MNKKIVWKQELAGRYISDDGSKINVISDGMSLSILVTDDYTLFEYFNTMDDLANYLNDKGLPPLYITPRSIPSDWTSYDNFDSNNITQKVWCKSTEAKDIEVLMLINWENGLYSLYLWDSGYQYPMHFETDMLDYIENKGCNPESDFDVAVVEAMSHGASGMTKTWRDLTLDEVKTNLKNFGIKLL